MQVLGGRLLPGPFSDQGRFRVSVSTGIGEADIKKALGSRAERCLMADLQKPGETPAGPGEYKEVGPRGGDVPDPRRVTIEPGDTPLPPTQEKGRRWKRTGPPRP